MIQRYENLLIGDLTDEREMIEDENGSWVMYEEILNEIQESILDEIGLYPDSDITKEKDEKYKGYMHGYNNAVKEVLAKLKGIIHNEKC